MIIESQGPWGQAAPHAALCAQQIDHAHLSAAIASAWRKPAAMDEAVWQRFCRAVGGHDDGWLEADAAPEISSTGKPRDFLHMPDSQHLAIWRRGSERWVHRDPFAALMVTLHARWLATKMPPLENPADVPLYEAFMQGTERSIKAWQAELQADPALRPLMQPHVLKALRRLLGWLDLISLSLLGAMPGRTYTSPVPVGDEEMVVHWQVDDGSLRLSPWPLSPQCLELSCPVVMLPALQFESSHAFREVLRQAPRRTIGWMLRPGRP